MTQPIKLESLRELVAAGSVKAATILGQKGGYAIVASVGMQQRPLGNRQGGVRMFSTTDTAVKVLRGVGVYKSYVDSTQYEKGSLRPGRPDSARKNRAANAALEHDRWFREQVQGSLDKIEKGTAVFHDHDEMWNELEAYAHDLAAKRDAGGATKPKAKANRIDKKAN